MGRFFSLARFSAASLFSKSALDTVSTMRRALLMRSDSVLPGTLGGAVGFTSTVFHLWVTPDSANATPSEIVRIAAAGPTFSLVVGMICWTVYRRQHSLMFLMLSIMGIYTFLGPLVGGAFGGDANTILRLARMPSGVQYGVTVVVGVALSTFIFSGRELLRSAPAGVGRVAAVMATVIATWLVGTALAVLLYLPAPSCQRTRPACKTRLQEFDWVRLRSLLSHS